MRTFSRFRNFLRKKIFQILNFLMLDAINVPILSHHQHNSFSISHPKRPPHNREEEKKLRWQTGASWLSRKKSFQRRWHNFLRSKNWSCLSLFFASSCAIDKIFRNFPLQNFSFEKFNTVLALKLAHNGIIIMIGKRLLAREMVEKACIDCNELFFFQVATPSENFYDPFREDGSFEDEKNCNNSNFH